MEIKDIAIKIAQAASDKKGRDILMLDMKELSPVTDYFVICSAGNSTLVKAIADSIEDKLAESGVFPKHKEGYQDARWILLDYGDIVAHVFLEEERNFYNLEQLWADAPSEALAEKQDE